MTTLPRFRLRDPQSRSDKPKAGLFLGVYQLHRIWGATRAQTSQSQDRGREEGGAREEGLLPAVR